MSVRHELKTHDRYWVAIAENRKPFEVRKNDRSYQTGDILALIRTDDDGYYVPGQDGRFSKQIIEKRVTYILQGGQFGIEPTYCVMGLGDILSKEQPQ